MTNEQDLRSKFLNAGARQQSAEDSIRAKFLGAPSAPAPLQIPPAAESLQSTNPVIAFGAGAARGVLEPFGFISGIDDAIQYLQQYRGNGLASKVGYALGFMGGFAIPGGAAVRLGGVAARGAGFVRAVDGIQKLTRAGIFTQGAIAGAVTTIGGYGVGDPIDSAGERIGETAFAAGLGGLGDLGFTMLFGRSASKALKTVEKDPVPATPDTAELAARLQKHVDDLQPLPQKGVVTVERAGVNQHTADEIRAFMKDIEENQLTRLRVLAETEDLTPTMFDGENMTRQEVYKRQLAYWEEIYTQWQRDLASIGQPKRFFHGTATGFKSFDPERFNAGLRGKGVYVTDNPAVGAGYADISIRSRIIDLDDDQIAAELKRIKNTLRTLDASSDEANDLRAQVDLLENQLTLPIHAPNVRPVYVISNKPFDEVTQRSDEEIRQIVGHLFPHLTKYDPTDLSVLFNTRPDYRRAQQTIASVQRRMQQIELIGEEMAPEALQQLQQGAVVAQQVVQQYDAILAKYGLNSSTFDFEMGPQMVTSNGWIQMYIQPQTKLSQLSQLNVSVIDDTNGAVINELLNVEAASLQTTLMHANGGVELGPNKITHELRMRMFGAPKTEQDIDPNFILSELGYDAIRHTGGGRIGDKSHEVYVVFDPRNTRPVYYNPQSSVAAQLNRIGLTTMEPGTVRVVPQVNGEDELAQVLDQVGDTFRYARVKRGEYTDILVAHKANLDDKTWKRYREIYKQHGFMPGQIAVRKGMRYILTRPANKPGWVMAKRFDRPGGKAFAMKMDEMLKLDFAVDMLGGNKMPKAINKAWAEFVEQYGAFPAIAGTNEGFLSTFSKFAAEKGWDAGQSLRAQEYFLKRQMEALRGIGPDGEDLYNALTGMRKVDPRKLRANPEGELAELAAQRGLLFARKPIAYTNKGAKWGFSLKDVETGAERLFRNKKTAIEYLRAYQRDLKDFSPIESPFADLLGVPAGAGGLLPSHTAGELSNVDTPIIASLLGRFLPRGTVLREVEEGLSEQGLNIPLWSKGFNPVLEGIREARNAQVPVDKVLWSLQRKLRDGKLRDKYEDLLLLFDADPDERATILAGFGDKQELASEVVDTLKKALDDVWKQWAAKTGSKVTSEEFSKTYFKHFREASAAHWIDRLKQDLAAQGKQLDEKVTQFLDEYSAHGTLTHHEINPIMLVRRGVKAAYTDLYAGDAIRQAKKLVELLPNERSNPLSLPKKLLDEYLDLAQGGTGEVYHTLRVGLGAVFKKLGLEQHIDARSFDRIIDTLVTMNYGAFMGFRPGLAIRNMTQVMVTLLPLVQDLRSFAHGLRQGTLRAGIEHAKRGGAIVEGSIGVPMEEVVFSNAMNKGSARVAGAMRAVQKVGETLSEVSQFGLAGDIKIGSKRIPVGLYQRSDEFTRTVAFHAMRHKVAKHWNEFKAGTISKDVFNERAKLTMLGPAITNEFHSRASTTNGIEAALDWIGTQASNETMYVYSLGAGPAIFSHGVGKLFGMYGTWPTWYLAHLKRGLTTGTSKQRALFAGYTIAVNSAFASSAYVTGVNLSRWTGLSSLEWTGSAFFDMFKDLTDIIGGRTNTGEPTGVASIKLGQYGLRDQGGFRLDPRQGHGFDIADPARLAWGVLAPFTPGAAAMRDMLRLGRATTPQEAMAAMLTGATATQAGRTWPEIN